MAEAYFSGEMFITYQKLLRKIDVDQLNQVINGDFVNGVQKTKADLKIDREFIDVLLAYIHSPLQTRRGRVPLSSDVLQQNQYFT